MCSFVFSLQLNVSIEDKDGTKLYGTTVDILRGNEVVASKPANKVETKREGEFAMAQFELEPNMYFIRLKRGSYPDEVVPVVLEQSVQKKLVMLLNKPTYTLYGQIIDEPVDKWNAQKLYVIDSKDAMAAQSSVYLGGYYAVERLDPAKTYRLRLGEGEDRKVSAPFQYTVEGIYYLQIDLRDTTVLIDANPKMTGVGSAQLGSVINVYLRAGEKELSGEQVNVNTPKGEYVAISDANGVVSVGAADYGKYVFEWKGQRLEALVQNPNGEEDLDIVDAELTEPSDIIDVPVVEQKPVSNEIMFVGAGFAGMMIIAAIVLGVVVVGAIAFYMSRNSKPKKKRRK